MSNHRSQCQTANHNQRNQPQLHRPALDQNPPCAHREPDQQSQHRVHSQGHPQPPGRSCIRARAFQLPARIRLGIVRLQSVAQASPSHSGAQGRVRTSVGLRPADLQSAAINHSATCAFPLREQNSVPGDQSNLPLPANALALKRPHSRASAPVRKISGTSEHCTSSGIPAEDRPGTEKNTRRPILTVSGPVFRLSICGAGEGI